MIAKYSPSEKLSTRVFHAAETISQIEWDQLSKQPFSSHRWYTYGEAAMDNGKPTYILVKQGDKTIARATFWLINNEPLPIESKTIRSAFQAYLSRRPLFICRSPLANFPGLILPEQNTGECLRLIIDTAQKELHRQKGSFLLFDFMPAVLDNLPADFIPYEVSDPGTFLNLHWDSFEHYLASGNKKDRQHYKRSMREAEALGLELSYHRTVPNIDEALPLIHNVEQSHKAAENPWSRTALLNIDKIPAIWLEIRQQGRLVGCGLLVEDNGALMATSLGLAKDVPYAYFMLVYTTLQEAFARNIKTLRMGSGAYEVKRRLGFELEDNNHAVIWINTPALRRLLAR